jgi:hypothetical protein
MSQIRRSYNGYIIQSTSFQLRGMAGFTPHLLIIRRTLAFSDEMPYDTGMVFASNEGALAGGIAIGRGMIDSGLCPAATAWSLCKEDSRSS